jgi:hypothetical protein
LISITIWKLESHFYVSLIGFNAKQAFVPPPPLFFFFSYPKTREELIVDILNLIFSLEIIYLLSFKDASSLVLAMMTAHDEDCF